MRSNIEEILPVKDRLLKKITTYYSTIWKDRWRDNRHNEWLNNFNNDDIDNGIERLHAIYLLSKFMYFGNTELRELLKCLYRDLFKYPIIAKIRQQNKDTTDKKILDFEFEKEISKTRFLGVGNPSESGVHLLYYFRQENSLSKDFFINTHEIFKTTIIYEKDKNDLDIYRIETSLKDDKISRYIFIDDFCGSGTQAKRYSREIIATIKMLKPEIEVHYLMLFGTEDGIQTIKTDTKFDRVESIFSIDKTFKCFSDESRYFSKQIEDIEKDVCKAICEKYGQTLCADHPLGYKNGQLLLSLFHNTPDNTLPIFWGENDWAPIFKRFHKIY
jgi:hypothetical protein